MTLQEESNNKHHNNREIELLVEEKNKVKNEGTQS